MGCGKYNSVPPSQLVFKSKTLLTKLKEKIKLINGKNQKPNQTSMLLFFKHYWYVKIKGKCFDPIPRVSDLVGLTMTTENLHF